MTWVHHAMNSTTQKTCGSEFGDPRHTQASHGVPSSVMIAVMSGAVLVVRALLSVFGESWMPLSGRIERPGVQDVLRVPYRHVPER